MILFRIEIDNRVDDEVFYCLTLKEARDTARKAFDVDESTRRTTVYRCATRPAVRGGALIVASLNGTGWMAEGSLMRVETYTRREGTIEVVSSTKGP